MAQVLLISANPVLQACVERLAAAAGCDVQIVSGIDEDIPTQGDDVIATDMWTAPAMVLIDAVAVPPQPLPRRPGVVVITSGEPDAGTWQAALALGADHVVALPDGEPWLLERLGAIAVPVRAGRVIAVIGSAGGLGASTLACALAARTAARGLRPLLVDADRFGGGLEVTLGMEGIPGARWPDIGDVAGRISAATIAAAFPERDGVTVVSHRRGATTGPMTALPVVVDAARRTFDLIIIDAPRDVVHVLADTDAEHWVVVTADRVRAVIAAAGLVLRDDLASEGPIVVLRRLRGPICVDPRDAAEALSARIDLELTHDRGAAEAAEHGDPLPARGPVATAADRILDRIGILDELAERAA